MGYLVLDREIQGGAIYSGLTAGEDFSDRFRPHDELIAPQEQKGRNFIVGSSKDTVSIMSLAFFTAAGFVTGTAWVLARRDHLITTMGRARLSLNDRADTARVVSRQIHQLGANPANLQEAHEMYRAVLRHQHTLAVAVPPARRDYKVLQTFYEEWTQDWSLRLIRGMEWSKRYYFEDLMEAGSGGHSEAEVAMRIMRQAEQDVEALRQSLLLAYPNIEANRASIRMATARGIRRALVPSSPR